MIFRIVLNVQLTTLNSSLRLIRTKNLYSDGDELSVVYCNINMDSPINVNENPFYNINISGTCMWAFVCVIKFYNMTGSEYNPFGHAFSQNKSSTTAVIKTQWRWTFLVRASRFSRKKVTNWHRMLVKHWNYVLRFWNKLSQNTGRAILHKNLRNVHTLNGWKWRQLVYGTSQ